MRWGRGGVGRERERERGREVKEELRDEVVWKESFKKKLVMS